MDVCPLAATGQSLAASGTLDVRMKYPRLNSINRIPRYLQEKYGWWQLRNERLLWRDLAPLFGVSASKGCTFYELLILFKHIVRKRPAYVLELGAGISTVVLGHAALRVRAMGLPCTIVSLEEDEFYFHDLKKLLPKATADCVRLVLSSTEERAVDGFISRCYSDKPRFEYDLVFVDGPQVPKDARYFDGDILDVVDWNPNPFTTFVDSRKSTRDAIVRMFPKVRMSYDSRHKLGRFDFPMSSKRK